ncbi:MAG: hypothetical protein AAFR23_04845 [Pseudomonadota bacterium]
MAIIDEAKTKHIWRRCLISGIAIAVASLQTQVAIAQDRFSFGRDNPFGDSGVRAPDLGKSDRPSTRGRIGERPWRSIDGLIDGQPTNRGQSGRERSESNAWPGSVRPTITWRVENAFRFFTDPDDTDLHRETFASLTSAERRDPILSAERQLGQSFGRGWAAELKGRVCWDVRRNLHSCERERDYVNPREHAVLARVSGVDVGANLRCTWAVRANVRRRDTPRERRETAPCHQAARLKIPYPSGATVTVRIGGRDVATRDIKVEDLLVVGIGDSFGSGEGNPDVPVRFDRERSADYGTVGGKLGMAGYPARIGGWSRLGDRLFQRGNAKWLDQACHRSLYSHQLRAALQLAIEQPHRAITFLHLACSGAEITRGLFLRYKGHEWVPNPPAYSQISAIARAQCGPRNTDLKHLPEAYHMGGRVPELKGLLKLHECDRRKSRKIDLMFVSIGGNDVGFARLVTNAVLREATMLRRLGGWFGQLHTRQQSEAQLVELRQRYKAFKRALHYILHIPWKESDRVILTAYPALALLEDGRTTCPSGKAGMEVFPAFYLDKRRTTESQRAADKLHVEMRRAARRYGWSFAASHRRRFVGRGVCAGFDGAAPSSVDDLRFPRLINGRWTPYNPADFRPYAPRQRWFRTPNDAYLTGHFHVASSLMQAVLRNRNLNWTQVMLASTYSGAFHPTAEGQAAIGDAVTRVARRVLEKYDGGNRRN